MSTGKRIVFFDFLKAICILLVIFCHFPMLPDKSVLGNVFMTISWSSVPCFMMVSGSIMHQAQNDFSWKKHLLNQLKIYAVICIWRVVYLIAFCFGSKSSFDVNCIIEYIFFFKELDGYKTGVIWYMRVYFMIMCIYPVTYHLFKTYEGKKILIYVMVICFIQGIFIPSTQWFIELIDVKNIVITGLEDAFPFNYEGNSVNLFFYFLVGAFLYEYKNRILDGKFMNKYLPYVVFSCATLILLLIKYTSTHSLLWGGVYLTAGYKRLATVFLSISLYIITLRFSQKHINLTSFLANQVGKYTLGVFYVHYIMLAGLHEFVYPYLETYYSFGMNCLKTFVALIICLVITRIGRKIPVASLLFR